MEEKIIYLYGKGLTYKEISRELSTSFSTISKVLTINNIKRRPSYNLGRKSQHSAKNGFKNGHTPWNKGIKTGIVPKTAFKKGRVSNRKGKKIEDFYKSKEICDKMRKVSRENAKNLSKLNNKYDTLPERLIENYLLFSDILYIKQYRYELGVADFWLPETNTIVEADGDYWHSLPGYKERDDKQTKYLQDNGYNVLRFSEHIIKNNFEQVIKDIEGEKIC